LLDNLDVAEAGGDPSELGYFFPAFCFAQRARCATAIRSRPSAEIVLRFRIA
jgi:hypothetical protein